MRYKLLALVQAAFIMLNCLFLVLYIQYEISEAYNIPKKPNKHLLKDLLPNSVQCDVPVTLSSALGSSEFYQNGEREAIT